ESAGAEIDAYGIKELLANPAIKYLAEMMNYPGVLFEDEMVMQKIAWAKHFNKPVDGHAPGLTGEDAVKYIKAGISTDHECFTAEEAEFKLAHGMKILIREGSAAKNFNALIKLCEKHYKSMMFCSDDKHPDDLLVGHINDLVKRAIAAGYDLFKILEMACINPVEHYQLDVGLLNVGDPADFIIVNNLKDFKIKNTYLNGDCVADNGQSFIKHVHFDKPNQFNVLPKVPTDFRVLAQGNKIRVIEALDGELITNEIITSNHNEAGFLTSDLERDILKMTVVNRYQDQSPAMAFIKNVGLKEGAIASSVGHDSHNIIAVGVSDEMICKAVNAVIEAKGGIAAVNEHQSEVLPLPVAGIMSDLDAETTGKAYEQLDQIAKDMGATLKAPYMTLSFMALLVIPALKLSDKGLFDGSSFKFTPLQIK
ncbi:MAG: adenine deaminase C-terminal domain-containing protein, partial [Crocinitomicaceae bacterium]